MSRRGSVIEKEELAWKALVRAVQRLLLGGMGVYTGQVSRSQYEQARAKALWRCPRGVRRIEDCEGYLCSLREYDECWEVRMAKAVLRGVWLGFADVEG